MIQFFPDREVGGIKGWWWPQVDVQTWDLIKQDWEASHRRAIVSLMNSAGKSFNTVIQAGGNCGMYPRLLANLFKHVYTFEPDPLNFTALAMNCPTSNIFRLQAALGENLDHVSMVHRTMLNVGMHKVEEGDDSWIPEIPLDHLSFKEVDLIWLDIEDYEIHALKGAVQTIKTHQPVVMCENATEEVKTAMLQMGYSFQGHSVRDGVFTPNT